MHMLRGFAMNDLKLKNEISKIKVIPIKNEQDYKNSAEAIAELRNIEDRILKYWEPQIKSAYATHKELCKKRDEMLRPVRAVMDKIKAEMNKYTNSRKTIETQQAAIDVQTVVVEKKVVEVKNIIDLLQAIIAGKVPVECVSVNMQALHKLAEITDSIPGCEVKRIKETIVRRLK